LHEDHGVSSLAVPVVTVAAIAVTALAGCSGSSSAGSGVQVVASTYPLAYAAERIAGPFARVSDLTHPGQEPHDLELTVQQTAELADADLVVYEKGFQPAVDDAVTSVSSHRVVDAAAVAGLEGDDPHFWLDPERLGTVAAAVERQLADADPDHARAYSANLSRLQHQLAALDRDYRRGLARCRTTTVVVSHDAFGYLGRYGLSFASIDGLSPEAEPSPDHLAQLRRLIQSKDVTTVFTEPLASPATADALARDAGVRTATLDPIEGLTDATADEDYQSLMRRNLQALRTAGQCT
jgi:zinc transport system substrate-binding protein